MKITATHALIGAALLAAILMHKGSTASLTDGNTKSKFPKGPGNPAPETGTGPPRSMPPPPTLGPSQAVTVSFEPSDSLKPSDIANAQALTVRQIQQALLTLGAVHGSPPLAITGAWDLPTQQAVWDWQDLHTTDNPQNPLNVSAEFDALTQQSIQTAYAKAAGVSSGFT